MKCPLQRSFIHSFIHSFFIKRCASEPRRLMLKCIVLLTFVASIRSAVVVIRAIKEALQNKNWRVGIIDH